LRTLCVNLTPINPPDCPSKCRANAVVETSQNGVNLSLKDSGERSKSKRCLEIKFLRKKFENPPCPQTRIHQFTILSHCKEAMLQLQIAEIFHQMFPIRKSQ
jgi:hypothetical protein